MQVELGGQLIDVFITKKNNKKILIIDSSQTKEIYLTKCDNDLYIRIPKERLEKAISKHFDFVEENEGLVRFLINEIMPNKERCQMLKKQLQELFDASQELQEEIDQAAKRNEIEHINVITLFQTILTLNIFPSVMNNYISNIMNLESEEDIAKYKEERKKENIKIIMKRLQKI